MAGINPPKPPMFPTLKPTGAPTWCDPNQCADWGCEGMDSWCTCYQEGVDYPCEDDGEECQCLPKSCARSWTCPNGWKDKTDLGDRMMDIPCPNDECSNDICCTPPPTPAPTESPTQLPTGAPTKLSTIPMAYSCGNFPYMDVRNKRNTIIKGSNCVPSGVSSGPNAIPDCRSLRQTSQGARPTATSLTYRHSNRQTCHLNGNFRYSGASCSGKRCANSVLGQTLPVTSSAVSVISRSDRADSQERWLLIQLAVRTNRMIRKIGRLTCNATKVCTRSARLPRMAGIQEIALL